MINSRIAFFLILSAIINSLEPEQIIIEKSDQIARNFLPSSIPVILGMVISVIRRSKSSAAFYQASNASQKKIILKKKCRINAEQAIGFI